jgi:hypothetical protein
VETILLVLFVVGGAPVLSYLIVKFGAAGYFRAKRREDNQTKNKEEQ